MGLAQKGGGGGGAVKPFDYYKYKVNKLPGDVLPDKCKQKVIDL